MATKEEILQKKAAILKRRKEVAILNNKILEHNKRIRELQKKLLAPDNKRVEGLERLIADAVVKLTDVPAVKKDFLQDPNINVLARARSAVELLNELLKKPFSEKDDELPELDKEKEEKTKGPDTQKLGPDGEPGQPIETKRLPVETQRLERPTELLSQTREDVIENAGKAATGETTRLAQTGDTSRLAAAGENTRLATGDDNKRTISLEEADVVRKSPTTKLPETTGKLSPDDFWGTTTPLGVVKSSAGRQTEDLSKGQVIYKRKPTQFERYQAQQLAKLKGPKIKLIVEQIERVTNNEFKQIQEGDAGVEWKQAAAEAPDDVKGLVEEHFAGRYLGTYVVAEREEADQYKTEPAIAEALERRDAFENRLKENNLLEESWLKNDDFKRAYSSQGSGVNNTAYDTISNLQSFSKDEYVDRAEAAYKEFLHRFNEQEPGISRSLTIPERLQNISRPTLPQAQLPYVDQMLPQLKSKITAKLGETSAGKAVAATTKTLETGVKAVGATTTKFGAKGVASLLGKLAVKFGAGAATGGAGWVASLVPGALRWLKKHGKDVGGLAIGFLSAGILLGNAALGVIGVGLMGLSVIGGGPAAITAGIAAAAGAIGSFLMTFLLTAIIVPLLISVGIAAALITIVLFIINTGGYLTPKSEPLVSHSPTISLYMEVQKTPSPAGPFQNSALERDGLNVTYTITIKALQTDLTNIQFANSYSIFQDPTVASAPQPTLPNPPGTISQGDTHTLSYVVNYKSDFKDAVVCDNFRVSANVGGSEDAATSTACITIGDPPTALGCEGNADITAQLASRITNGQVHLLPQDVDARSPLQRQCIRPTMIGMHWAGNPNDNPRDNEFTYSTLVSRNLACQVATDPDDVWLMQPFYQTQVEMAWCINEWNIYTVNYEMGGVNFTSTPPPPNLNELELTYDAVCEVMNQYHIPWTQVRGHYEINPLKTDPGRAFLQNVFIPEIRRRCPNE